MFKRHTGKLPLKDLILFGWMPSSLKKYFYRKRGYIIADTAHLGFGSILKGEKISIGEEVKIGFFTFIIGLEIKIEPRVRIGMLSVLDTYIIKIGEGTRLGTQVVIGGLSTPRSSFIMGRNGILMEWSFINTSEPVLIGDDVGIGGHCLFFTHGLWPNGFEGFPVNFGPIEIEDKAWLAWRVSVLPGVKIGAKSIISSDACLTKSIPALSLVGGVPGKVIRDNGTYIGEDSIEIRKTKFENLMLDFEEWVTFNDGQNLYKSEEMLSVKLNNITHTVYFNTDNSEKMNISNDCILSLNAITLEKRKELDSGGVAWMDIENKERSLNSNQFTEELEEFIRRIGLRLLKYSRW